MIYRKNCMIVFDFKYSLCWRKPVEGSFSMNQSIDSCRSGTERSRASIPRPPVWIFGMMTLWLLTDECIIRIRVANERLGLVLANV